MSIPGHPNQPLKDTKAYFPLKNPRVKNFPMVHGCCQWVSNHNRFSNIISAAYRYTIPFQRTAGPEKPGWLEDYEFLWNGLFSGWNSSFFSLFEDIQYPIHRCNRIAIHFWGYIPSKSPNGYDQRCLSATLAFMHFTGGCKDWNWSSPCKRFQCLFFFAVLCCGTCYMFELDSYTLISNIYI